MALLQASYFDMFVAVWSVPNQDGIQVFTGSVDLVLSTGIVQIVVDRVSTDLTCIHYMGTNKLYYPSPDEDLNLINLRSKLLVLENINQKIMNSYASTYHGSEARAMHRRMFETVSLPEALASCGFRCVGLPWGTDSNPKMEANRVDRDRPRLPVVGCLYKSPNSSYTNRKDVSPILIAGGPTGHDHSNPSYP